MKTRKWYQDAEPVKRLTCFTGVEEGAALAAAGEGAGAGAGAAAASTGELGSLGAAGSVAGGGAGLSTAQMVALGLQGAGALAKMQAQQDAIDRQKRLADAMTAYKLKNADQQVADVQKYAATDTPDARAQQLQDATNDAKLSYDQSVGAAQAFTNPGDVSGNVSQQFKDAGQASADAAMARTNKLISNLSAMRAPGLMQQSKARAYGQVAGDVGALKSASNSVGGAYQTDIGGVVPNPWAGFVGDAASGIGQGIATNAANQKTMDALQRMRAAQPI